MLSMTMTKVLVAYPTAVADNAKQSAERAWGSDGRAPRSGGGRRRLQRGSLTPELIVSESLRILDEAGTAGFSMPNLGRALGADPTAVYRHFASKDDLVLAIADYLIEVSMAGLEPQECWIATLTDCSRRCRKTYQEHPAAASL